MSWWIICPDGKSRHLPYHNEGDAEADAATYGTRNWCWFANRSAEEHNGCPGGVHTVTPGGPIATGGVS